MKRSFFPILVFFLLSVSLYSQTVEKVIVKPYGQIYQSAPTKNGVSYRITVKGTYSMWNRSQSSDSCEGVDAAYVYDVPTEEYDAGRWPKPPILKVPRWVGDDSLSNADGYHRIHLRKYTGFRIDNEPLLNTGFNLSTHSYQTERVGTGLPFSFQILDTAYIKQKEGIGPSYNDNHGQLIVTIEELWEPKDTTNKNDVTICDIGTVCDSLGNIKGLRVSAAIFEKDSAKIKNRKNLLKDIDISQLGIVYNGQFICPTRKDCINTDTTVSVAIGILVDRSGTMGGKISEDDPTIRIVAAQKSINRFIDNFQPSDSAFVMTFETNVRLDQDWTSDTALLKSSINKIQTGDRTKFFGAVITALDTLSKSSSPKQALVVLSDGANNELPFWDNNVKQIIAKKGIPIYIVALGFTQDPGDIQGRMLLDSVALASGGKVFNVNNASKLDAVYDSLAIQIRDDECCTIYVDISEYGCDPSSENFLKIIYAPRDTITISKVINFNCDCGPNPLAMVKLISPKDKAIDVPLTTEFVWHTAEFASKYRFSVSKQSNLSSPVFSDMIIDDTTAIQVLEPQTTYYWAVKAFNDTDSSKISATWSFTTIPVKLEAPKLESPENQKVEVSIPTALIWHKVNNATKYIISVCTSANLTDTVRSSFIPDTIYSIMLDYNTTYYWRAKAFNDSDSSDWSETWHFTTLSGKVILKNPEYDTTNVRDTTKFAWYTEKTADRYQIQLSKNYGFTDPKDFYSSVPDTTIDFIGANLDTLTQYFWRVRALKGQYKAIWSDIWRFETGKPWLPVVEESKLFNSIILYPNPTDNKAQLSINYAETCEARISISNAEGKIIKTEPIRILQGDNRYEINTKNWNSGSYYITIITPSGYITRELVVVK